MDNGLIIGINDMNKTKEIEELKDKVFEEIGHSWACDGDTCVCRGGSFWEDIEPIILKHIQDRESHIKQEVIAEIRTKMEPAIVDFEKTSKVLKDHGFERSSKEMAENCEYMRNVLK